MRRLLRRLLNGLWPALGKALGKALCLLSLLAWVGTCAAWARSYRVCDAWTWEGPGGRSTWYTSRGQFANVRWALTASTSPVDAEFVAHETRAPLPLSRLRPRVTVGGREGAGFADWAGAEWGTVIRVRVAPFYAVALPLSLPPLAWLALNNRGPYTRRRRRRLGLCLRCGYDLRATPAGGGPLLARCPECGAVPAPMT